MAKGVAAAEIQAPRWYALAMPSPAPRLVLASGSPRRRELLRGLGLDPLVRPVDIDETPRAGEAAEAYVARLAETKARARGEAGEIVLAADTVVTLDGALLGKPIDEKDARDMLRRLAGREHAVLTGVALWEPAREPTKGRLEVDVETTRVVFAPLDDDEIAAYVATGEPMDKAGAYAIQGRAAVFVERIEGNYSNVVGLPLPLVYRRLRAFAVPVLAETPRAGA